jgi:cephalosporin-C deacetylase-like acetyl esterase
MKYRIISTVVLTFFCTTMLLGQQKTASVFESYRGFKWYSYKNNDEALYRVISEEAFRLLDARTEVISELETKDQWLGYQNELRDKLFGSMEKFKRTPLNATVTGKIKRKNFTVEKILFESHPGFYVTGCLFLPKKRQRPAPAIIYCSGHTDEAFRNETYQNVILNLVEKGFVVFAYDPIGQGERSQYVDKETGVSKIGLGTREHSYSGMQILMTGTSITDYFIWDGSRAVDYLISRKEVDSKRIGITGRSGGGTQSAMISAYDKRIYAAAPEAWFNNFKRLFQSIGAQDAEQNPYNAIANGIDYPDYLHVRAPRPSLIVTTTHDFFSVQGARETFKEAQGSYAVLGKPLNIQITEDMGKHESTEKNRESVYAFFQEHLGLPGDPSEKETTPFATEELWVSKTGQIGTSIESKTVFDLKQTYFSKKELPKDELRKKIKEISGIRFDRKLTTAVYTGKLFGEGYEVEKYFLEQRKEDYALPVYMIKKATVKTDKILVWLNGKGKDEILKNEMLSKFLDAGFTIISADLPGIGELYDPEFKGDGFIDGVPNNYVFGAHLIGKSIPGIQAEGIDLLMQFVAKRKGVSGRTYALVEGGIGSAFLHFVSLKNSFGKIVFSDMPDSNRILMETEYYNPLQVYNVVPGSLPFYDVDEMISLLPADTVKMIHKACPSRKDKTPRDLESTATDFLLKE